MDQALSAVAWQHVGRKPCVTVQLGIVFIDSVRSGSLMVASGQVVRATRSLLFLDGTIRVESTVVATSQGLFKTVRSGNGEADAARHDASS